MGKKKSLETKQREKKEKIRSRRANISNDVIPEVSVFYIFYILL